MSDPRESDVTDGTGVVATDEGYAPHDWGAADSIPGISHGTEISNAVPGAFDGQVGDISAIGLQVTSLAATAGGFLLDPVGFVIEAGLGFLIDFVQPLEDLIGLATGNAERMQHEIEKWTTVRQAIAPLSQQVSDIAASTLQTWTGPASEIAKTRIDDLAITIANLEQGLDNLILLLNSAKALAETLVAVLQYLIAQFLKPVVYAWISAIAAAGPTFGGSTAAAASYTAVQYAFTVVRFGQRIRTATGIGAQILRICMELSEGLGKLGPVLDTAAKTVPPLANDIQDVAT